ncbi:hypothetical protein [Salipaludibacillus neizhouensis]|nr:hypothetical protein [Salipaludibacillus neizhouensis]
MNNDTISCEYSGQVMTISEYLQRRGVKGFERKLRLLTANK